MNNNDGMPPCENRLRRHSLAHYLFVWCFVCCAIFLGDTLAQAQGSQGYQYSQTITLSHTQVPNTDQTNFPVLISGTYPYLATVANGGQVTNSNGYDIIFTSDPAGTTQLDHEIDSYNPVNGTVSFWVRIPTLSHTTDTLIYLFYGNPNITTSQENKAGVWSSGYSAVWHFGGTTLSTNDSTSNAPTSGTGGTFVTINGSGFGSAQSDSTVAFNGLPASVNSWSDTQIIAAVPETSTGPVSVTIGGVTGNGPIFTLTTVAVLTNSQGNQTTYTSTMVGGVWVLLSAQGPGCSTCSVRNNQVNTYDSNGNLLTRTDANGNTITYTYDSNNDVLSKSAQLNGAAVTTSYTYNSFGEVLTVADPLGNTTTNTYDAHGNLSSVTSPAPNGQSSGSVTQFAYNGLGELTQITDPLGHSTTLTYYPTGLVQTLTDAQNNTTSYTYDTRGNRTSVIDPINGSAHPTTFNYDVMNRLLGITYPNGTSVTFGYDYRGRRISATDQNNHTSTYSYDDADRLLSIKDPANNLTQLGYDTEGNVTSITDANNHTTSFTYDAFGRTIQTTFPSSLIETYGYDSVGNLTSKTDRKGQTIQYVYDALYRLTNKIYPDSTSANYVYDLVGKIRQVTDPTGSYGFAYDNMGRLIGTVTQYSFLPGYNLPNSYAYDAASNRTSMTAPDGSTNIYSYDTINRLNTLTSSLTGQFGFNYDALSRRTQLTRPNGVTTSYSYDAVSNLLSILHQTGSTTFDGSSYGYDNAYNRTSNTNYLNTSTSTYGYDAIYELLSASGTDEAYTYDAVGNRLSSANVSSCSYGPSNQLVSSSLGSYTYDANGNTLTDPSGKQYTWDFENRLTQVVVPGTGTIAFKYDPFGRRIYKSSPSFLGAFAYDGFNLIQTMNSAGSVLARYTMTQNIDEPLAMQRSGSSGYYETDGLGSVTSLTSATGSVANTYTYDSFGNTTNLTGTLRNPFLYAGREYDSETSLYFNRARYYNPSTGRFISEDPAGLQGSGMNFYAYVHNSPTNLIDPSGLCGKQLCISLFVSSTIRNLLGVLPIIDSPPIPEISITTPTLAWIYQTAADYLNPLTLGSAQGGRTAMSILRGAIRQRASNSISFALLLQLDIAMTQALITEINAAKAGECRAIGEN